MIEIADTNKISTAKYVLEFDYINFRGEKSKRKCIASSITYGMNEWHKEPQWLLFAFCLDKMDYRTFAMKDMENIKVYLG